MKEALVKLEEGESELEGDKQRLEETLRCWQSDGIGPCSASNLFISESFKRDVAASPRDCSSRLL